MYVGGIKILINGTSYAICELVAMGRCVVDGLSEARVDRVVRDDAAAGSTEY